LEFWSCFPFHACLRGRILGPNLCEETRDADSIRCGQCHTDAYAHQSECYECRTPDVLIAWLGPFLYPLLMIFGFLPPLIRSLRSMDMDHTKKARRLIRTEKHTSWLGRLAESDHGEFRMIIIMITCLQT
ncbi:UGT80B1, partial [Symbiodinium sp. KB8]